MVVMVKLEGLNIIQSRGKWYVYVRETKEKLLGGFVGTRDELEKRMAMPDFMAKYNAPRLLNKKRTYDEGTLGALVYWFENDCSKYQTLSDATKADYTKAFAYLRPEFDYRVGDITQADIYDIRDKCAKEKKGRFADKMVSALSSMFSQAVKRRKMGMNPALGLDKAHSADPNANREWQQWEWDFVRDHAPRYLLTPMMIARYAGYRGQTIVKLSWRDIGTHAAGFNCFRKVTKKNQENVMIPIAPELQVHLDGLDRGEETNLAALMICTRQDGTPWDDEKQMQTAVSHYLRDQEALGKIGAGTTLHGLRTSYAADLSRNGADTGDVAAALGDKSERMGAHYTRHVENETKVIRAFAGKRRKEAERQ
ncbi:integrase [Rhizobium sp. rho-13.1]|uniref:tyrosine-type recombinase/integrase n=1 Tax=Rhizobium sp. rho-13.1 TaxID=2506431 RepID=UPI00115D5DA6|nr:tyrosine-type recombinase/integrase [Rhizobium sp. rho-13.1]TQX91256.1 integrase [Rhizobium sp. rho-13.1]